MEGLLGLAVLAIFGDAGGVLIFVVVVVVVVVVFSGVDSTTSTEVPLPIFSLLLLPFSNGITTSFAAEVSLLVSFSFSSPSN